MILRRSGYTVLLCLCICVTPIPIYAQLTDNLGGLTDENLAGYLGPLNTGLSGTMNSAIFRTGDVPAFGVNFSIGLAAMAISFDDEDKLFLPIVDILILVNDQIPELLAQPPQLRRGALQFFQEHRNDPVEIKE